MFLWAGVPQENTVSEALECEPHPMTRLLGLLRGPRSSSVPGLCDKLIDHNDTFPDRTSRAKLRRPTPR